MRLTSPEFIADPYPTYAWLRQHAPVYFSEDWQGLCRHALCRRPGRSARSTAVGAARSSGASQSSQAMRERLEPSLRFFARWALFADPPEHTRLRGLLNRAFLPS